MVKRSLTVSLRSSNPVPQIAYLIETALHEHCDLSPEIHADYQLELSTVTGLGLTAILAEGSRIRSCRPHFATFLRYRNFTRHTDRLEQLSHAIASIICNSIYPFKKVGFPFYYDSFLTALANTLKSPDSGLNAGVTKGIKKIMQDLFEQCS